MPATSSEDNNKDESTYGIQICIRSIDELAVALGHPELLKLMKKVLSSELPDYIGFK